MPTKSGAIQVPPKHKNCMPDSHIPHGTFPKNDVNLIARYNNKIILDQSASGYFLTLYGESDESYHCDVIDVEYLRPCWLRQH